MIEFAFGYWLGVAGVLVAQRMAPELVKLVLRWRGHN